MYKSSTAILAAGDGAVILRRFRRWFRRQVPRPSIATGSTDSALTSPTMRAERLRVLLQLVWEEAAFDPIEPLARGFVPLSPGDIALLFTADELDLATANACLRAASERRAGQWAALEALLALVADRSGTLEERLAALPDQDRSQADSARGALGWAYH